MPGGAAVQLPGFDFCPVIVAVLGPVHGIGLEVVAFLAVHHRIAHSRVGVSDKAVAVILRDVGFGGRIAVRAEPARTVAAADGAGDLSLEGAVPDRAGIVADETACLAGYGRRHVAVDRASLGGKKVAADNAGGVGVADEAADDEVITGCGRASGCQRGVDGNPLHRDTLGPADDAARADLAGRIPGEFHLAAGISESQFLDGHVIGAADEAGGFTVRHINFPVDILESMAAAVYAVGQRGALRSGRNPRLDAGAVNIL